MCAAKHKNPIGRPPKLDEHKKELEILCRDLNVVYGVYLDLFEKYQKHMKYFALQVSRGKLTRTEYDELGEQFTGFYPRYDKRGNY